MKDRILLINPPGDRLYSRDLYHSFSSKGRYLWQPTDILFLSGRLSNDFDLDVIDAIAEGLTCEETLRRISGRSYHGIISLTGSVSFDGDFAFFDELTRATRCPLYLTGDLVASQYRQLFSLYPFVTGCIADFTSPDILPFLRGELDEPRGMAVRRDDHITPVIQPARDRTVNIPPPRHDLFPLSRYRFPNNRSTPMATILGSAGCPFSCSFCAQGTQTYRYREAENILEEIRTLHSMGIREIYFRDQLLEAVPKNFLNLLEGIVKEGYRLGWTCDSRVDTLKPEWLPLMKQAGCHTIIFGVENPSQGTLDRWLTKKDNTGTPELFRQVRKNGIDPCAYFILGLPGETREDVLRTIDYAIRLNPSLVSFALPSPDFGTELRDIAVEKGVLVNDLTNTDRSWEGASLNDDISDTELAALQKHAWRRFYLRPGFVLTSLRSIRSWTQLMHYFMELTSMVGKAYASSVPWGGHKKR